VIVVEHGMKVVFVIVSVLVLTSGPFGPPGFTPPPFPPDPVGAGPGGLGEPPVGYGGLGEPVLARADPAQAPRRIVTSARIVRIVNHPQEKNC
jgi:hypothetical protein